MLLLLSAALAAELEQVRVFVGDRHAQVLLLVDEPIEAPSVASEGRLGKQPARSVVRLPDAAIDARLKEAYGQEEGHWVIPVGQGGVERVLLEERAGAVFVTVELDLERDSSLAEVGESGLLLDLKAAGADPDPSLPDAHLLEQWLAGVSLSRQGGEVSKPRRVVVIDPGHGGEATGAIGLTGTKEADIALALSFRVKEELEERMDVDVVMTRTNDTHVSLDDRAAIANAVDADLFISIHANAAPADTVWGITTFYMDAASDGAAARVAARENAMVREAPEPLDRVVAQLAVAGTNQLSRDLAYTVQTSVIEDLRAVYGEDQIRDMGVQTALFYVLVSTSMPAILYEASFLTHPDDEMRLRTPAFQEITAMAIADAVVEFFATQAAP